MKHSLTQKRIENIESKLNSIDDKLSNLNETLIRNTNSLELHMKRSEHLENIMEHLQQNELNPPTILKAPSTM